MDTRKPVRQGDILLRPIETPVLSERRMQERKLRVRRRPGLGIVLAEGEATGHHHVVKAPAARLYRVGNRPFLRVLPSDEPVTLTHDEHDPIELGTGWYEVVRQREYDPSTAQRRTYVRD